MASKTGEDMVIDAKKLCLTFDTNDGPVHALKDVDLGIEKVYRKLDIAAWSRR